MPIRPFSILAAVAIACCGVAQDPTPPQPQPSEQKPAQPKSTQPKPAESAPAAPAPDAQAKGPHFLVRQYPRDRDVPVAVVGGKTFTLGNVVDHIASRHHPGFVRALETQPGIQRMLQSDLLAPWVRHFADLEALRQSLGDQQPDQEKLGAVQSETLKARFQNFLDAYVADGQRDGRPTTLSQEKVNKLLADFQLNNGLSVELQGMLDYLEPGEYTRGQLHGFFTANPRVFGGQVTIAHILVQHRDAGTGILLNDEGLALATARLADIKARLLPDGSNFEEVARMFSDDTRTGKEGGRLEGVYRFDDRLPAALCRAAWTLRDGEISDVVESQYGWHLVKRIEFFQNIMILFTDDAMPSIKTVMRRARQEDLLFQAREKAGVRLLL